MDRLVVTLTMAQLDLLRRRLKASAVVALSHGLVQVESGRARARDEIMAQAQVLDNYHVADTTLAYAMNQIEEEGADAAQLDTGLAGHVLLAGNLFKRCVR